jgi:hypothetical protein
MLFLFYVKSKGNEKIEIKRIKVKNNKLKSHLKAINNLNKFSNSA